MEIQNLVLVIYKNKVLLISLDFPLRESEWGFIEASYKKAKNIDEIIFKQIKALTQLNIEEISKLPLKNSDDKCLFYVKLTDKNVNEIKRRNGYRIEFYGLSELEKLSLSQQTQNVITEYGDEMRELLSI